MNVDKISGLEDSVNIKHFLDSVAQELKAINAARKRYAARLSPEFNCFDYISHDEMRLSQIMADLLNPKGDHAQKDKFLLAFLKFINVDWDTQIESVEREKTNPDGRRPDIRITWKDNRRIDIENKPRARDGKSQLSSYIETLKTRPKCDSRQWCLIYLSGSGQNPTTESISKDEFDKWVERKNLIVKPYKDLVTWITECISVCESERFRWFLGEFKTYVRAEFMGVRDMSERQAIVEQTLKTKETFEAAWQVSMAMEDIKQELLKRLKQQLHDRINQKRGWKLNWDSQFGKPDSGFSIYFLPENEQKFVLRFEFALSNDGLGWGIKKKDKDMPGGEEITKIMLARIGEREEAGDWWLWSAPTEKVFQNWKRNEPWARILEDSDDKNSLAAYIIQKAEEVHDIFAKDNRLDLLMA